MRNPKLAHILVSVTMANSRSRTSLTPLQPCITIAILSPVAGRHKFSNSVKAQSHDKKYQIRRRAKGNPFLNNHYFGKKTVLKISQAKYFRLTSCKKEE